MFSLLFVSGGNDVYVPCIYIYIYVLMCVYIYIYIYIYIYMQLTLSAGSLADPLQGVDARGRSLASATLSLLCLAALYYYCYTIS